MEGFENTRLLQNNQSTSTFVNLPRTLRQPSEITRFNSGLSRIKSDVRRSSIKQIRSHPIIRCKPDPSRINSRSQPSRNNETGIHSDLLTYFTISEIIVKADFVPMISSLPNPTERDRIFPTVSDFSRMRYDLSWAKYLHDTKTKKEKEEKKKNEKNKMKEEEEKMNKQQTQTEEEAEEEEETEP
ncbi:hypothetical protein M8J75_016127 [Diaphorina citri]|nr:hypothetical protein M8J75_016127 [Diaphorina citri]